MQYEVAMNPTIKVGDEIEIIDMVKEPQYKGRTGFVTKIDDAGQLHGTWGSLAIIPSTDKFKRINTNLRV
jgi:hypothetical protein